MNNGGLWKGVPLEKLSKEELIDIIYFFSEENKSILERKKKEIDLLLKIRRWVNMPRGDKTGPSGQGSKTGRGLGDCPSTPSTPKRDGSGRGVGANKGRGCDEGTGNRKGMR